MVSELTEPSQTRRGVVAALTAYVLWGLTPLFWPLLGQVGALEVLAHRFVWSAVLVLLLGVALRIRWWTVFRDPKLTITLGVIGALIGINWGIFIWAVNHGHALDAALGYYINPLLSIVAGVVLLKERLPPVRWVAVGLAAAGVAWMTIDLGQFPWVALALATSFAIYGVIKKGLKVDAVTSLTLENLLIAPFAMVYLVFLAGVGSGSFAVGGWPVSLLLIATGAVSLAPLLLFAVAAPKIPLSLMGMLQYVAPTMQFILGIVYLGETMSPGRWIGFFAVWLALVLVSADSLRGAWWQRRLQRRGTSQNGSARS